MLTRVLSSWTKTWEHVWWSSINCETAKLQCDSRNLRNTEICQSPSGDSHFDPSVRQMGLNGSQIFCFFLFVSALNAVRCTTRPQTVQPSANGWPNAQMIQRRPTTSAHTLKMYGRHKSDLLPQGYAHTATSVQACVWMWSQPGSRIGSIHPIGSCSNLDSSIRLCHGRCVVSFLSQTTTSLQICDGCARI